MDVNKLLIGALLSACMAVLSWIGSTTLELKLAVQRLEIIMQQDAMTK